MAITTTSKLQAISTNMRKNIIRMLHASGSGHPGGSLSAVEIMASLFFGGVMDVDPKDLKGPKCDRFILSKGHAAPVLYATFAELGILTDEELLSLRKLGSKLQGHPDMNLIPEIEISTGSLGQGFSVSTGLAKGLKMQGSNKSVFCLLGDGELEEGQVWEAVQFAAHHKLNNLVAIVDNNGLQIDGAVKDVAGMCDVAKKFEAFGWHTAEVDGHNLEELIATLEVAKTTNAPYCVVAKTVKGKGVSFMENQAGWHGNAPNDEQAKQALEELEKGE